MRILSTDKLAAGYFPLKAYQPLSPVHVAGSLITNIYNGTDTKKFNRTPEMAVEAINRYPLVEGSFVVGCIGSFEARKAQSVRRRPCAHCCALSEFRFDTRLAQASPRVS